MKKVFILLLSFVLIFSSCTSTDVKVEDVPQIVVPAAPAETAAPVAEEVEDGVSGTIVGVSKYGNTYLDTTTAELL